MNKMILILAMCIWPCFVLAKDDMSKQEKAIVKALKKQYKLESVDISRPYDGYTYYRLQTKDFKYMIADANGEVIIPQSKLASDAYIHAIKFVTKHEKGIGRFRERGREGEFINSYYPGNEDVFITQKGIGGGASCYEFWGIGGSLLSTFEGTLKEAYSAPLYISKDLVGQYGLLTMDGIAVLPTEYDDIDVNSDGICYLEQNQGGVKRQGGVCISELTDLTVPCIFYSVEFSHAKRNWYVQVHEFDSVMLFNPKLEYDTSYIDKGQMLFEQGKYEEARKFYSIDGDTAQWADFFIGAAYYKEAERIFHNINYSLDELESSYANSRNIETGIKLNLERLSSDAEKAEHFLRLYQKSHAKYFTKSKEMLYELSEMRTRTKGLESRLSIALSDLELHRTEIAKQEKEERQKRQQQLEQQKLTEQRLAREQREREMRMRQKEYELRKQREKQNEEKRKKAQQQKQPNQPVLQSQRKNLSKRKEEQKENKATPRNDSLR